jgi:hypothetical protein
MKPSDRINEIANTKQELVDVIPEVRDSITLWAVVKYLDEEYENRQLPKIDTCVTEACKPSYEWLEKRNKQLETWLHEASNVIGGCDLDQVAVAFRNKIKSLETSLEFVSRQYKNLMNEKY